MAVVILGGSNCLRGDGWVPIYRERFEPAVRNLSIGATTSLTGIYRFLQPNGPEEGDTVVWGYSMTEGNIARNGSYAVSTLLKNVEHLLILCRERKCRFVPMIFMSQADEEADERSAYFLGLADLLDLYGLDTFDLSQAYRRHFDVPRIPPEMFLNPAHYARTPEFMEFIAEACQRHVVQARVPRDVPPNYTGGRTVVLETGFCTETFTNSILDVPAAPVPQRVQVEQPGRMIAVYALCHPGEPSGIRVRTDDLDKELRFRFSATINTDAASTMFKAISVETAVAKPWAVELGGAIRFAPAVAPGQFHAEMGLRRKLKDLEPDPKTQLAGILLEVDA